MTDIPRTYDAKGEFTKTYPNPSHGWTCFHCGMTFYCAGAARWHFGLTTDAVARCIQKMAKAQQQ